MAHRLLQYAQEMRVNGPRIFDLQIAIISIDNGAHEIWTHDGKFTTLPGLKIVDPIKL